MKIVLPLLVFVCVACESTPQLTGDPGKREFTSIGTRDDCFHAAVKGLELTGFEIDTAQPNSLYIEATSGERTAILQGDDLGNGRVVWQLGLTGGNSLQGDFKRITKSIDKQLKKIQEKKK